MLIWRCGGETMVIPMVDSNGDDNMLMTMLVDKLPERVKGTVEAAVLRGIIADLRGDNVRWRIAAGEAMAIADELRQEREFLNGLEHIVPVEAS